MRLVTEIFFGEQKSEEFCLISGDTYMIFPLNFEEAPVYHIFVHRVA